MKIIISHDVDHIAWGEHWLKDMFVPKWLVKNLLYVASGKISPSLAVRRCAAVFGSRMHRIPEVMNLDMRLKIPSTFFIGMARGMGMSYSVDAAARMVNQVLKNGFSVGVHGVSYANGDSIRREHDRLVEILKTHEPFGVRNHYLRFGSKTLAQQARAGYLFDSSEYGLKAPYVSEGLVEFPVCMMDSYLLGLCRNDGNDVKRRTLAELEKGKLLGLPVFTVIFHDCYFSDIFPDHREWYLWLARHLSDHYEMTDFAHAVRELNP